MSKDKINFTRTINAIKEYDEIEKRFQEVELKEPADIDKAVRSLEELEKAGEKVGLMYGLDTSDRNSVETCRTLIRPGSNRITPGEHDVCFVRRMVRDFHDPSVPALKETYQPFIEHDVVFFYKECRPYRDSRVLPMGTKRCRYVLPMGTRGVVVHTYPTKSALELEILDSKLPSNKFDKVITISNPHDYLCKSGYNDDVYKAMQEIVKGLKSGEITPDDIKKSIKELEKRKDVQ